MFSGERKKHRTLPAPEIVFLPARHFIGKSITVMTGQSDCTDQVLKFYRDCEEDQTLQKLFALKEEGGRLTGINDQFTPDSYRYTLAAPVDADTLPTDGMRAFTAGEGQYARFVPDGLSCIETWREIYNRWLPGSGYRYRVDCELEVYPENGTEYASEIFVPIQEQEALPELKRGGFSRSPLSFALLGMIAGLLVSSSRFLLFYALGGGAVGLLVFFLMEKKKRSND